MGKAMEMLALFSLFAIFSLCVCGGGGGGTGISQKSRDLWVPWEKHRGVYMIDASWYSVNYPIFLLSHFL